MLYMYEMSYMYMDINIIFIYHELISIQYRPTLFKKKRLFQGARY